MNSNIFVAFTDPIVEVFNSSQTYFFEGRLNDLLSELVFIADKFNYNHSLDYTTTRNPYRELEVEVLGEIYINQLSYYRNTDLTNEDYDKILDSFFEKYEEFKRKASELKLEGDLR